MQLIQRLMGNSQSSPGAVKPEWDPGAEELPIEAESAAIETRVRNLERSNQGPIQFGQAEDKDEEQNEEEIIPALQDIIDLTDDASFTRRPSETQPARNISIPSKSLLQSYDFNGSKLEPGLTVEMQTLPEPQQFRAAFLHIKQIFSTSDGIKLRGTPLTRMRNLRGRLPRLRNELAMVLHVDSDDDRPEEVQAAIEVPITDIVGIRNCHFTNADFPRYRTVLGIFRTIEDLEKHGVLMCRWRCIFVYRDAATRVAHVNQKRHGAPLEYIVEHITAKQVTKKRFRVPETGRFNVWRGGRVRGGEYDPENEHATGPVVQLDGDEDPELVLIAKRPGQRYTFGDMFCGAGGASCGAQKAGFQVKLACDNHPGACETYSEVFQEARLYEMDIFRFITDEDARIRVDVLHLSPPCQFWSPAHTCAGVNDEANIAVLFSCRELVRKLRPRLVTLEQTFGILHPRFEYYFNALVHGFTEHGYSVRWRIVDLVDWGSPATRKRLIMIGSCAGEDLPPFPEATHAAAPGSASTSSKKPGAKKKKKPHVTVRKMLARIPRDASQHDDMHQPHEMARKRLAPWDADAPLRRCITTNGGVGNHHPSGRRDFTPREYATLQTFPVDYPFRAPDRKRQIGNAFPPQVAKVLYAHLRRWLEGRDRVYAVENEPIDPDDPDVEIWDLEDDGLLLDESSSGGEDVEYVGSQQLSSSSSSSYGSSRLDVEDMDLDISDGEYGSVPCADANQRPRRRIALGIDVTGRRVGLKRDYIELTNDD
ncbi:S-adenosyl-L-methionine-dependent methyltransferase [Xylaria palmicola]|nr:S-adenosyl-L-methionine-dependent methyltransferase [Xylaria palmicola]